MTFNSRLLSEITIEKAMVNYHDEEGNNMEAEYNEPITISPKKHVEIWTCPNGCHTCISFWDIMSDGREVCVTGNIPSDTKFD